MPLPYEGPSSSTAPAVKAVPIASAGNFADGACRGLWTAAAGTVSIRLLDNSVVTNFPLVPGFNPIFVIGIASFGTLTAGNVWALY